MDDFLEIMSLFGFDLDKATEYVQSREDVRYTKELLDRIMEESCVDKIQSESDRT